MDDIYSLLNVSANASKEELKAAFIAWKKPRQEILRTGTREEQAQASYEISEMTKLYKEACASFKSAAADEESKLNNDNDTKNSTKKYNVSPPPNLNVTPAESKNTSKILNAVLCVVIVILGGLIVYLYNKNSSTPVIVQNTPTHIENSHSPSNKSDAEKISVTKPVETKPVVEDKNVGKTPAQREAIQTLLDFHENITKKSLRQAYDCMSYALKDVIPYEGWTYGFNTTVSSTPTNIKVVSESSNRIVLTYDLIAVDNPGGTTTFAGTIVIIRTSAGWKIDDIKNIPR